MQQHGQVPRAGQDQLSFVEVRLPLQILMGHKVIQADLAHGDQTWVIVPLIEQPSQGSQVLVDRQGDGQGMDAQGIRRVKGMRELTHPGCIGHTHGRQHQASHTHGSRSADHICHIVRKLRRIEVAVGINPFDHGRGPPHDHPPAAVGHRSGAPGAHHG